MPHFIPPKQWKHRSVAAANQPIIDSLSTSLKVDEFIAKLLVDRNIHTFEDAKSFFRPTLNDLLDPFLLKDMDKAVVRVQEAIAKQQKIMVYGDYDVDGTTSVALMYSYLKIHTSAIEYYIPDRYKEGYGISTQGIDYAAANNFSLIIALDCGIKSTDKVEYASSKNIDFIICDHHLPGDTIPAAVAVLDPKRTDCDYPCKHLSGCGVGFKLLQALNHTLTLKVDTTEWLDLVAISICADIVPIVEENRVLCTFGLQKIAQAPRLGIKILMDIAGMECVDGLSASVEDVVFKIAPRINAAGRIDKATKAVELLLCEDKETASEVAAKINQDNNSRKEIQEETIQEAIALALQKQDFANLHTTILYSPKWHKGVVGIVASKLIENLAYRPTIILTQSGDYIGGSARSVEGFDLYVALEECAEYLEQFGGHAHAAGMTLKLENLPHFEKKLEEVVKRTMLPQQRIPTINYDAAIRLDSITDKNYRIMQQFAPFGPSNMRPIFISNPSYVSDYRILAQKHIKLILMDKETPTCKYEALSFNNAKEIIQLMDKSHKQIAISYTLEENNWMGKKSLQLMLRDVKETNATQSI